MQLEGICNFGIAHMIQNFGNTAVKWSRTAFGKHTKMHFLQDLFFEPIHKLNERFRVLVGRNIIHQEQHISHALKRMIKTHAVTESVKQRLVKEFDVIDSAFAVEKSDVTQFTQLDFLTKLDRVVLKSTLLFDSDYINDLSSTFVKDKIHEWALHEIGMVTAPVASILTGELSERKRELEENMKSDHIFSVRSNKGRWRAKRGEERQKLEDKKKLASLYSENLLGISSVQEKFKNEDIGTEKGPKVWTRTLILHEPCKANF